MIDDDVALARALARSLESESIEALVASDWSDAIGRLKSRDVRAIVIGSDRDRALEFVCDLEERGPCPNLLLHVHNLDGPLAQWGRARATTTVLEKPAPIPVLRDWVERHFRLESSSKSSGSGSRGEARLLGSDPALEQLREQVARVARFPTMPVLILGETGTGKELVAQAIHELTCPDEPFASLNCAAVPESLFETELFGHAAGAFTNALGKRAGLFEEAGRGTIFLDEIGELPGSVQPKLLRTLETRRFRRVGTNRELPLRARVISATNVRLNEHPDTFREDLFFRLAGYTIVCPPLRHRLGDVAPLATYFLDHFCSSYDIAPMQFGPGALDALLAHSWPGNIRELRGVIETAAVSTTGSTVTRGDLEAVLHPPGLPATEHPPSSLDRESGKEARPEFFPPPPGSSEPSDFEPTLVVERRALFRLVGEGCPFESLRSLERHVILTAYDDAERKLSRAARVLGIPRSTLRDKLRRFGVDPDGSSGSS